MVIIQSHTKIHNTVYGLKIIAFNSMEITVGWVTVSDHILLFADHRSQSLQRADRELRNYYVDSYSST